MLEIDNISIDSPHDVQNVSDLKIIQDIKSKASEEIKKTKKVNLMTLIKTDEHLIAFCGLPFQLLNSLSKAVILCEQETANSKRFVISVSDRIVMCFCKLRLNLSFRCLAVLFGVTRQTCANNFFYMIELLSKLLKELVYLTMEENLLSMPKCFKKFRNTRMVLDCTEIPVEKPGCLKCCLRLYSHYKGCQTIKYLIGVATSGLIAYVSEAFGGKASDKAIFNKSNILDKLIPTRDALMVDKGFDIRDGRL